MTKKQVSAGDAGDSGTAPSGGISKRELLTGTAELAAAAIALAPDRVIAQEHEMVAQASAGSNRIYDINIFEGQTDIAQDPTDIPPPISRTAPEKVRVDLETVELEARLDSNSTYTFWTFNGRVPGPFVRVRVGDHVEVHLKNNENSTMMHNVDFHAATGLAEAPEPRARRLGRRRPSPSRRSTRPLRLSLRRPARRPAYLERHVRPDPGGAGRRPAAGGSRVLRDAGRDLYRGAVRHCGAADREL